MSTILTTWLVISFFFTPQLDPLMKTHCNMEILIQSKQEPFRIIITSFPKPLNDTYLFSIMVKCTHVVSNILDENFKHLSRLCCNPKLGLITKV
jgi:hypothetical protein